MTNETNFDKALTIWANMNPVQRYEVMQQVGRKRSKAAWFRACIEHLAVQQ